MLDREPFQLRGSVCDDTDVRDMGDSWPIINNENDIWTHSQLSSCNTWLCLLAFSPEVYPQAEHEIMRSIAQGKIEPITVSLSRVGESCHSSAPNSPKRNTLDRIRHVFLKFILIAQSRITLGRRYTCYRHFENQRSPRNRPFIARIWIIWLCL